MKKHFLSSLVIVISLFVSQQGFAQLAIRPYVGLNSSTLSEDLFSNSTSLAGFGYQVGADLQIGNKIYFQPGIQFEGLSNTKSFNQIEGADFTIRRTYLRVPIMVGYRVADADANFNVRIFTGPNAAFKVSSSTKNASAEVEKVINENLKNAIFGWNAGVGIDFISIFFVDFGYQLGLSEIFEETEGLNSGARNNLFYANAGIRIKF